MKLFIANCTKQVQTFIYRKLETASPIPQQIEIGGQVVISGDLSPKDVDYIINQHRKYGLVSVSEIDRTKPFIGLCYSIDKPVAVDKLKIALLHNDDVLVKRGEELRKEAAVATSATLEQNVKPLKSELTELEIEITEVPVANRDIEVQPQKVSVTRDPSRYGLGPQGGSVSGKGRRSRGENRATH